MLHLIGKGSILDAIGQGINTGDNAIVSGVRDAGDLLGLGTANLTGNQVAAQNARNAIQSNDQNLSGRDFGQNLYGLGSDVAQGPVNTFDRAANTAGAGIAGLEGLAGYGIDTVFGNHNQAQNWLNGSQEQMNSYLNPNSGWGHQGGYITPTQAASTGGGLTGYRKNFVAPVLAATKDVAPYVIPGGKGLSVLKGAAYRGGANLAVGAGTDAASQFADTGKVNVQQSAKAGASNAAMSLLPEIAKEGAKVGIKGSKVVFDNAKANIAPLDSHGGAEVTNPFYSPEDNIHQHNPFATPEPDNAPPPEYQPSPADLAASQKAADQIDHAPQQLDPNLIQGAGKAVDKFVSDKANELRSFDQGATGGMKVPDGNGGYIRTSEHSPFYTNYRDANGKAPIKADYQAEAERQLTNGTDAEAAHYQNLLRHADAEQSLNEHLAADKQSGYTKVKYKSVDPGRAKPFPQAVKELIASPEFQRKTTVQNMRTQVEHELENSDKILKVYKSQISQAAKENDIATMQKLTDDSANERLRNTQLKGKQQQYNAEYHRMKGVIDEKFPDVVLKKPGSKATVKVSDETARTSAAPETNKTIRVKAADGASTQADAPMKPEDYRGFTPSEHEPYTGPNMNEGAFSPEDIANMEQEIYAREHPEAVNTTERGLTAAEAPKPAPALRLDGETAVFQALQGNKSLAEAEAAYRAAEPTATDAEAKAAVNRVADKGAELQDKEAVLSRNKRYNTVKEPTPKTTKDVVETSEGYRQALRDKLANLNKDAKGMSENDIAMLDKLRGNTAEDVIKNNHIDNPEQFRKVAATQQDKGDFEHEILRMHQGAANYRVNRGAGKYHEQDAIDEESYTPHQASLTDQLGTSKGRVSDSYEGDTRPRLNKNLLEDSAVDAAKTSGYVYSRSVMKGMQDVHGQGSVVMGAPDSVHPTQLNGTKVFGTPEAAAAWNKIKKQTFKPGSDLPEGSSRLTRIRNSKAADLAWKPYDAASSAILQATVMNPLKHTFNILQNAFNAAGKYGDIGGTHLAKDVFSLFQDSPERRALEEKYALAGGHHNNYGLDRTGWLKQLTHGATDLNRKFLATQEHAYRLAIFKGNLDHGFSPEEAVKQTNLFFGSKEAMGDAARRATIFLHYFKTNINSLATTVAHPIEYRGVWVQRGISAAALVGVGAAYQQFTGNKHAYVTPAGELAIGRDLYKSVKAVVQGHYREATQVGTNRLAPLAKEMVQQLMHEDLFSGKQIVGGKQRLEHAVGSLVSPAEIGSKVATGKKSIAETVGNQLLNLNTPHAAGAPAAPSGRLNVLNTSGAKSPAKGDPTGINQQANYFKSVEQIKRTLTPEQQGLYDRLTAGVQNPDGSPKGMNEKEAYQHYADLNAHPDILDAITRQKQAEAKLNNRDVDPLYSPKYDSIRQDYVKEQSTPYKGDDYDQINGTNKDLFKQLGADRAAYFKANPFDSSVPSERIKPPSFSDDTQKNMDYASTLSGAEKAQFISSHPDVGKAYDDIAKYTNDKRVAQGFAPFKLFPKADIKTQGILNEYFALPKNDGPNGKSPTESKWIKDHPDEYAAVKNYLAGVSEYELANSAGADKFQGATPSQTELKSAYSLGKYDIAKSSTGTYSINPGQASANNYAARSAGYSGGSGGNGSSGQSFAKERIARNYLKSVARPHSVHLKTLSQAGKPFRVYKPRGIHIAKAKTGKLRIKSVA